MRKMREMSFQRFPEFVLSNVCVCVGGGGKGGGGIGKSKTQRQI